MSSTSAVGDSGKVSGQNMTLSQTCNLLSQYVKEKCSLPISRIPNRGAVTIDGFNNNNRATMNLFPVKVEAVDEDSNGFIGRTINLFPQSSGLNNPSFSTDRPLMANACTSKHVSCEPPSAQMTIFYGGQVLVFNDLPGDKAKEVMDLACSYESSLKKMKLESTNSPPTIPIPIMNPNPNPNPNPTQNMNVAPNFGQGVIPALVPRLPVANVSDLPIARKASLHRFLEKRKDRLVGKAPPSNVDVSNGAPSKAVEGKSWLGLASMPVFKPQQQL